MSWSWTPTTFPKPTKATQRTPPWQVNPLNKNGEKKMEKKAYPLRVLSSKSGCHPNFLRKREKERESCIKSGRHSAERTTRQSEWVCILELFSPRPNSALDPALPVIRTSRQASWEHTIEGHWRSIAKSTKQVKPESSARKGETKLPTRQWTLTRGVPARHISSSISWSLATWPWL